MLTAHTHQDRSRCTLCFHVCVLFVSYHTFPPRCAFNGSADILPTACGHRHNTCFCFFCKDQGRGGGGGATDRTVVHGKVRRSVPGPVRVAGSLNIQCSIVTLNAGETKKKKSRACLSVVCVIKCFVYSSTAYWQQLDVQSLDCEAYTGNLHKWCFCPAGTGEAYFSQPTNQLCSCCRFCKMKGSIAEHCWRSISYAR